MAPVETDPEIGWTPLQAPLAEQLVALLEFQVNVLDCPAVKLEGEAPRVTVGSGVGAGAGP
jgi:hypothetical protein